MLLVSNDDSATIENSELSSSIVGHIRWRPEQASRSSSRMLAAELKTHGVSLAHFHFGGNYTWGSRALNACPLPTVRDAGIRCLSTNHGAFTLLEGYCASWRPVWLKLALLPPVWVSKMHILSHVETEIAVSQHDWRNLRNWYWPLREKFGQIYHSKLSAEEEQRSPGPRDKTVLCVGTIGFRKGQPILVEAFAKIAARHPEWTLVLAGRQAEPQLMAEIEKVRLDWGLHDRIRLVDNLSDQGVTDAMRRSEIFAMPSFQEGLGLSLQEALFHGCACVASRVGGIPELVQHDDNGLLVSAGDVNELAGALERLMEDQNLREKFRKRGPISIIEKKMTADHMAQAYATLYEKIQES